MLFSIKIEKVLIQKSNGNKRVYRKEQYRVGLKPTLYCSLEIERSVPYGHFCPLKNVPIGQSIKKD